MPVVAPDCMIAHLHHSLLWRPRYLGGKGLNRGSVFSSGVTLGASVLVLAADTRGMCLHLAWSPDGNYLISGSVDRHRHCVGRRQRCGMLPALVPSPPTLWVAPNHPPKRLTAFSDVS